MNLNFRFMNIPVRIEPSFWILLIIFSGLIHGPSIEGVIFASVIFVSLLIHEYGHAATAAYFGAKPEISLHGLGGRAEYPNFGISKLQSFLITLNGPLFESLLIVGSYFLIASGIFASHYYIQYTLYITMWLNIYWCLLNLLPIEPLDGGKLLRIALEYKFADTGHKASLIIGLIGVIIAAPYLFLEGSILFPVLLLIFGYQNYQNLRQLSELGDVSPFNLYQKGVEALNENKSQEAKGHFKRLLKAQNNHLKHSAIECLAKIYHQENKSHKSYDLLLKADPQLLQEGKNLLCKLAFERKNYALVGKYSHDIYTFDPSFETALLNSQAFACMNHSELAGGWLATASQFGIEYNDKVKEVLKNAVYDSVRNQEAFQKSFMRD